MTHTYQKQKSIGLRWLVIAAMCAALTVGTCNYMQNKLMQQPHVMASAQ